MKRKITLFFILSYVFFAFTPFYCNAKSKSPEIVFEYSNTTLKREDDLCLSAKMISPDPITLSSLKMKINFDKHKLTFKDKSYKSKNEKVQLITKCPDDTITLVYTNLDGLTIDAENPTNIFDLHFKVKKDATFGTTNINAVIKNIYDNNLSPIEVNEELHESLNITHVGSSICTLKTLSPSEGTLNIPFDPNVYDYSVDVPYDTKDITFDFDIENPESTVKVSRHKLKAAGEITEIRITVSNKKEKVKRIYTVMVNRAPKPPKDENTPKSKSGKSNSEKVNKPKISSGKKSKSNKVSNPKSETKHSEPKFYSNDEVIEDEYENSDEETESDDFDDIDDENNGNDSNSDNNDNDNNSGDNGGEINETSSEDKQSDSDLSPVNSQSITANGKSDHTIVIIIVAISVMSAFSYSMIKILPIAKEHSNFLRRKCNNTLYLN